MSIGYSVSSGTTNPAIKYAGRLFNDPVNSLAQGEGLLIQGAGHQLHSSGRWGDYSALSIDPTDGCTFWHTNEYFSATSTSSWNTQIGSFKFGSCGSTAGLTITASPLARTSGNPSANSPIATVSDAQQPSNTLVVTVNGGTSATVNGVTVTLNPINPNVSGQVFADVVANCTATTANFTLRVTNTGGSFLETPLTVTVNPAPSAMISPTNKPFTSSGGTGTVTVTSSSGCPWTAVSNDSWVMVTSGASGAGNGMVGYSVAANISLNARTGTITIAGQTFTVNQAAYSPQGFHDGAGSNTISGWAWDPNNPNGTVNVDIYDGNTLIGTTSANMYREDLLNALASPLHGFSFLTPASLKNGAVHTINVKFSGINTLLSNTGRAIQSSLPSILNGRHDGQGCNAIEGWAWDGNDANGTVNVDIYDSAPLIGTVACTLYRQDLADVLGSPYHGFIFHTPPSLRDGQPHTITVKFGGTNTNLPLDTPRTTSCTSSIPNHQGNLDVANCITISGYAWDANDDQGTINAAIYVDGGFFVVVPAQEAYPGVGSGYHGFKFAVPASLKNGQSHSIEVRFSGTSTSLPSSPKTIVCPP